MSKAKFRTIAAHLADRIHRGDYPPGTRLPAERVLAAELGVNRSTVVAAYDELMALGLVSRRHGSGTFVQADLWGLTPDWQQYIAGAAFAPIRPWLQRIRQASLSPNIIDLSDGVLSSDLMPLDLIQDQLGRITLQGGMGYPDPLGDRWLRQIIAAYVARYGIDADPDTILITSGTQQAIYLITRALLSPGDAIAIEQPSYYYSLSVFQSAGIRLFPLPVDDQGLNPQQVRQLYERHRIRMVITTPTFQSPTGTTLPEGRRQALLAECRALNIPLVEDDVFRDLALENHVPAPIKALDTEGRVLYLGSTSKALSPALRVGWMVGPRAVVERLAEVKAQMDFGSSILPQRLAGAVMNSAAWPAHLQRVRSALRERRDALVRALQTHFSDAITFQIPAGGMHLWTTWKQPYGDQALLEAAIESRVICVPGRVFGAGEGHVRFSFSKASPLEITGGIEALAERTLPRRA